MSPSIREHRVSEFGDLMPTARAAGGPQKKMRVTAPKIQWIKTKASSSSLTGRDRKGRSLPLLQQHLLIRRLLIYLCTQLTEPLATTISIWTALNARATGLPITMEQATRKR